MTSDSRPRRFKTPTLRGVALTAPYMHDGSLATLEDVVEFYRSGGNPNPVSRSRDSRPLRLSPAEILRWSRFSARSPVESSADESTESPSELDRALTLLTRALSILVSAIDWRD